MKIDPIPLFKDWFNEELKKSTLKIPSACCFSTIGIDGYPNSRFVSLKEIKNEKFVITGPLNSRKGNEVKNNTKVSLTFWWTATQRQVRIQGDASVISKEAAAIYFRDRNEDAKVVSVAFNQGEEIENFEKLDELFLKKKQIFKMKNVECPDDWGGFFIKPKRIELMEFATSRLHKRTMFFYNNGIWNKSLLQP